MTIQEAIKSGKKFKVKGESDSCLRCVDKTYGYILYCSDKSQVPLSLIHFDEKIDWEVKK